MLVQLVAEGLEDGLEGAVGVGGAHFVVEFLMQGHWLPFPGSFGAHGGGGGGKRVCGGR